MQSAMCRVKFHMHHAAGRPQHIRRVQYGVVVVAQNDMNRVRRSLLIGFQALQMLHLLAGSQKQVVGIAWIEVQQAGQTGVFMQIFGVHEVTDQNDLIQSRPDWQGRQPLHIHATGCPECPPQAFPVGVNVPYGNKLLHAPCLLCAGSRHRVHSASRAACSAGEILY